MTDNRPRLRNDRAFWGMTVTQFLGAFNDNLFKQIVLLLCVDVKALTGGGDYQSMAQAIFAVPFVLFSGFAGWLSDRSSKRTIVVLAKVAEIAIMLLGMLAFLYGPREPKSLLMILFVVLGCMSLQSAFFGPSKYGILPELFRKGDLPATNGVIQMTTFVAIILGGALAGIGKEYLGEDGIWKLSLVSVLLAVVGTGTSLLVRPTPVAQPGLKFEKSVLAIHGTIVSLLKKDRMLLSVLLVCSVFWFLGAMIQMAANELGKLRLDLGDGRTSIMLAGVAAGIAAGCAAAAKLSHHKIDFRLVTWGSWGMIGGLVATMLLTLTAPAPNPGLEEPATESMLRMIATATPREWGVRFSMAMVGFFGGLFVVPLQVYLQVRPPESLKGRMIGAMNLITWLGIVASAIVFGIASGILSAIQNSLNLTYIPIGYLFGALALLLLPIALFYRPKDETEPDPSEQIP